MGNQIIKETRGSSPGRYALWSSVSDDFLICHCTREELIDYLVEQERKRISKHVEKVCNQLLDCEKPYFQFTITFDKALERMLDVHGKGYHKQAKDWLGIK